MRASITNVSQQNLILSKKNFWVSNIQARATTEAVIPKYVQQKTILSLDVPSDLKLFIERKNYYNAR